MKITLKAAVLVLLSLSILVPTVWASGPNIPSVVTLSKNDTVNKDYFAAGDTVTLSGIVNGDAYIAGGTIIVDGTVNGDLIAAGGMITIRGTVKNDLRLAGGNIMIAGPVKGNASIAGGSVLLSDKAAIGGSLLAGVGNLEILGNIGKGVTAGVGNLHLNAPIGSDMTLGLGQLTVGSNAKVSGNLTYWSEHNAVVADERAVSGEITYHALPKADPKPFVSVQQGIRTAAGAVIGFAAVTSVFGVIVFFVFGLLLLSLLPAWSDKAIDVMQKRPWESFGIGFLSIIVLPILAVMACITIIGIPIGIALGAGLILMCFVGHIVSAVYVGKAVSDVLHVTIHRAWHLFIGLTVLALLTFLPVIGWLARYILVTIGAGAMVTNNYALYKELRQKKAV